MSIAGDRSLSLPKGATVLLTTMIIFTACSGPGGQPEPGPTATSAAATTAAPDPTPTPAATPETVQVPLALVVRPTRTVADVTLGQARAAVAGELSRWSQLGQPGGRVRVLRPDPTDGAAIDEAVESVGDSEDVLAVIPAAQADPTVRALTVDGISPLRAPDRTKIIATVPADAAPDGPKISTVTAVGDLMLGRGVAPTLDGDPGRVFRPFADRLGAADLTVGNFESTLSTAGAPTQGGDSFAADPTVLAGLESAGFDLVQLANNHVGDYGDRALRQTLDRFARADLPTVGAGRNLSEAARPVILERSGLRFGFLATDSIGETPAATGSSPGTNRLDMPPRTGPLDHDDLDRITADIGRLSARVDVVIVLAHWGDQYTHRPVPSQRRAGRAFVDAGADLVIGGHPHWVQGWERRGDAVIIHSLGNFVFDMDFSEQTMQGIVAEAVFWDGRLMAVEPVPYAMDEHFIPRPVRGATAAEILDDVWRTGLDSFAG
jgi:poly-gamma-glutamate synthesis protein (capsule biosynthesis protein)